MAPRRTTSSDIEEAVESEPKSFENPSPFMQYPPPTAIHTATAPTTIPSNNLLSAPAASRSYSSPITTASPPSPLRTIPFSSSPSNTMPKQNSVLLLHPEKNETFMEINFVHIQLNLSIFKSQHNDSLGWLLSFVLNDFEIIDNLPTSTWKTFCTSDPQILRQSDSPFLHFQVYSIPQSHTSVSTTSSSMPTSPPPKLHLKVNILPVVFYIDQNALEFLIDFFSGLPSFGDPEAPDTSSFESVNISTIRLKVDYKPKGATTKNNMILNILNVFPLEGAVLKLNSIHLKNITGTGDLLSQMIGSWLPDLGNAEVWYNLVTGWKPIRPLANVGAGMANLILLPIEQYERDGTLIKGIQRGTFSFLHNMAMETLNLTSKIVGQTQIILEAVDDVIEGNDSYPYTVNHPNNPNLYPTSNNNVQRKISSRASQPQNAAEGVQNAFESLTKELKTAAHTIIAIPVQEYQNTGTGGAVRSVVRAVPVAVLRPMIGLSVGFNQTLLGIRNEYQQNKKLEEDLKYKSK